MIITQTPFRISFFGGGTDYPVWYQEYGGAVLSTAIDKYCYITCRYYPPFFGTSLRIVWSKIELVDHRDSVEHPAVKGVMEFFDIKNGIEVHHVSDLPARSGLGAGSSFVVGMINALHALNDRSVSKHELAKNAIHVERDIMKESVGSQDQIAAAFGGFNKIVFNRDHTFEVSPVVLGEEFGERFKKHLMLFFTGLSRNASDIAKVQIQNTPQKAGELRAIYDMVAQGESLLRKEDLEGFGRLLHETWQLKRGLSHLIANEEIDAIYDSARRAGAIGGKLLGAGGGGFMLIYADPSRHEAIKKALKNLLFVPFDFDFEGSQVIHKSDNLRHVRPT